MQNLVHYGAESLFSIVRLSCFSTGMETGKLATYLLCCGL